MPLTPFLMLYGLVNLSSMSHRFEGDVESVEPPMQVTVIVPVYREPEWFLEATLRSLVSQTVYIDYNDKVEIWVVGTEGEELPGIVDNYADKVLYAPRGKLRARDKAIRLAPDGIIASVDADCIYPPTWLASHIAWYYEPDVVATTGPTDLDAFEYIASALKHFWYASKMNGRNSTFLKRAYIETGGFNLAYDDVYLQTRDTNILMQEEEFNFMERLEKIGRVVYVERPVVIHLGYSMLEGRGLRAL